MKLNKSNVYAIPLTTSGQKIYRDSELIGFAVGLPPNQNPISLKDEMQGSCTRVVLGELMKFLPCLLVQKHKPFWLKLPMVGM